MSLSSSRREKPVIRDRRPLLRNMGYTWTGITVLYMVVRIASDILPAVKTWLEALPGWLVISGFGAILVYQLILIFAGDLVEEERFQRRREKTLGPPEKMPDPDDPFRIPR